MFRTKTSTSPVSSSGAITSSAIAARFRRRRNPPKPDRDSHDLWNPFLDVHLHLLVCCCPHRHPEHGS